MAVGIVHTYIGDLKVDLVAPDGSIYVLHNRAGGSADNINQTYTVNLSSESLNGTWRLRVNDNANQDTGYINSWTTRFSSRRALPPGSVPSHPTPRHMPGRRFSGPAFRHTVGGRVEDFGRPKRP